MCMQLTGVSYSCEYAPDLPDDSVWDSYSSGHHCLGEAWSVHKKHKSLWLVLTYQNQTWISSWDIWCVSQQMSYNQNVAWQPRILVIKICCHPPSFNMLTISKTCHSCVCHQGISVSVLMTYHIVLAEYFNLVLLSSFRYSLSFISEIVCFIWYLSNTSLCFPHFFLLPPYHDSQWFSDLQPPFYFHVFLLPTQYFTTQILSSYTRSFTAALTCLSEKQGTRNHLLYQEMTFPEWRRMTGHRISPPA